MYNIPDNFNKELLVGLEVQQISFATNTIVIGLGQNSYLQIDCKFSLTTNGIESYFNVIKSKEATDLLKLLDKKITSVSFKNNDLTLIFEGENSLTIFPESNYESYIIVIDSVQTII